jgi:hypothetical protein
MGSMPFDRTLRDWLKFNVAKRTDFDASIASGYAIMAVNRKPYMAPQGEKTSTNKISNIRVNHVRKNFKYLRIFPSKPIDSFEKKSSKAFERLLVILFILSGFTTVRERADFILIVLNLL